MKNKRERVKEINKELNWYVKAIEDMDKKDPAIFEGTRFEAPRKKQFKNLLEEKEKLEKEKSELENSNDYKWN